MSLAKCCDVCGNFYKEESFDAKKKYEDGRPILQIEIHTWGIFDTFDLCPTCGNKVRDLLGKRKDLFEMMTTDMINNTINANRHNPEVVTDDISDGFHTFGQLYFQRMMLFATLVNLFPSLSWKTKCHEDGEKCFGGGWFLVTIETPAGSYGYHYEEKYWDMFKCDELDKAKPWDGYTEENVDRLFSLISYASLIQFIDKKYFTKHETKECPSCKGTGMTTPENKCGYCDGKGVIE